jgi:hypothetical protein
MLVNGHNNKITLMNKVKKVVIYGHNNRIVGTQSSSGHALGVIDHLTIVGHNNRFEGLKMGDIGIQGHNNIFISSRLMTYTDNGVNNKF